MQAIILTTLLLAASSTAFAGMTTADSLVVCRAQIDSLNHVAQKLESTILAKIFDVAVQKDSILKAEGVKVVPSMDESYVVLDLTNLSQKDYNLAKLEADIYCISPQGTGNRPVEVDGGKKLKLRKDVVVEVQKAISAALKE